MKSLTELVRDLAGMFELLLRVDDADVPIFGELIDSAPTKLPSGVCRR